MYSRYIRDAVKGLVRRPEHNWEKYYELKEGDVYVEAGAYIGRYGMIASSKVGSTGRVILIEPYPPNLEKMRRLTAEMSNVEIIAKAVWDNSKPAWFTAFRNPKANAMAGADHIKRLKDKLIMVERDTVDNLLDSLDIDKVDLFSADVEGAEVKMLLGCAKSLVSKRILHIAIGAYHHRGRYINPVMRLLRRNDYENIVYDDNVVYANA